MTKMGKILLAAKEQNIYNVGGSHEISKGFILRPVRYTTMSSKDILEYCTQNSMVPPAYVAATMHALTQSIRNFLLNGHSVEFPNLGTFRITCESTATNDLELAGIRQLLDFKIRFLPSNDLKEELAKIECELEGVYEIVGERVLERDADGKPIRTEKIYSKVRGGEDELLDEDEGNTGNGTGGSTPGGGGGDDDLVG
jgi:nucleoid DNA-binding protein